MNDVHNPITLFSFDDVSIPFTHNLCLSLHPPQKLPDNPVVRRGKPGTPDSFGVQFYGSIVRHEDKFKLWYIAVDEELGTNGGSVACWRPAYAESIDGIHWEKPSLGLVEYKGSRDNNLLLIEPAPLGAINLKVLIEPDDPDPSRRFKMTIQTWWWDGEKRGSGTLVPLLSADGFRWRLGVKASPVNGFLPMQNMLLPRYHFEAAGGLYRWKGFYHAAGQTGAPVHAVDSSGRAVTIVRSANFMDWSDTATLSFIRNGQHLSFPGGSGEEAHEGVSVWHRGNVLLGLYGLWHGAPDWAGRTIDLGFVISNDGLHFREPITDFVFIPRGQDRDWDQGGLLQGQGFENVGDQTYIWYGAWDPRVGLDYVPRGGVGLATLERDRFGSLSARDPSNPAAFVTSALQIDLPARLWINADGLSPDGKLWVELLDELERPLAGFSGDDAAILQQSGLRIPVSWKGKERIPDTGAPFKIRVTFEGKDIKFYALYVGE